MSDPIPLRPGSGGGGGSRIATPGGTGGGGGIPPEHISTYIDAKMDGVRSDLRLELHKELEPIKARLDKVPGWGGHFAVIATVVTTALTVLALVYTFFMHGNDRREAGVSLGFEVGRAIERGVDRGNLQAEQAQSNDQSQASN